MMCEICGCLAGEGQCSECSALAREMRANAEAIKELRYDELPLIVIRIPRRKPAYPWLAAAAGIVALGVLLPRSWQRPPVEEPRVSKEALTIKMLTPDPTVVIYWLADAKEEKQ
jgi:hypothetical protein